MILNNLKVGDVVKRMLGGSIPMELKITKIDDKCIYCGPWKFSKNTGGEIDEDLHWDGFHTGSYLKLD